MKILQLCPDCRRPKISDLKDAWLRDIRAHQDQCPATFSNCVPHDCGCGLTELREAEMGKIEKLNNQPAKAGDDPELMRRLENGLKEMNKALIETGQYD